MNPRRVAGLLALLLSVVVGVFAAHLAGSASSAPLVPLTPERKARLEREREPRSPEAAFSEPDAAIAFYVNSRTGPIITRGANLTTGARTLDPARYLPAIDQMRNMSRFDSATNTMLPARGTRDPVEDGLLATWSPLGPGNQGGRTRGLLIDPTNPNVMYAGGVAGGVWKSTNGGDSWLPVGDLMANIAISTLAFDPQNPSIVYAGTGEGFFNADAIRGAGIFRTTDAGLTWNQIPSTNTADFHYTMKVVVSPRDSQRIFAATRAGLFRSTNGGTSWSTLAVTVNNGCTDLAVQAGGASGYLFAGCGTFAQATIYRLLDDDVSAPESVFSPAGMGRASIAVAPSNESTLYVLGSQSTSGGGPGQHGLHGVYRSTASGAPGSFTTQRQGNVAPANVADRINQLLLSNPVYGVLSDCGFGTTAFLNQGWYDNVIAVDPADANRVWVGGIDLWRSDDGGVNWGTAGFWWFARGADPQYHHADQHAIVFHPQYNGTSNRVMFAGSDGGVDRVDDARAPVNTTLAQLCGAPVASGATWVDRNAGYVTTQFYDGAPYPNGQSFFGGLQDNGTLRGSAGNQNWNVLAGGDGGYVAVDTLNDANSANDVLFLTNTRLSIQKSVNGGATFSSSTSGISDGGFAFIAPFAMNEASKQHLWTGGWFIWRTTNQATTPWVQASAITTGNGSISAVAAHPLDANRVLVGMSDGYIHFTTTALTNTSSTVWPQTHPTTGYVSWVAWDPNDVTIAYATVSQFGAATIFKSVNGGATWTATQGSGGTALPQIPALSVVVNPANSQQVFVGTDLGVFVSLDGGASWLLENAGFANTPVEALKFNETAPRQLFAFTHGRGAWSVGTGCPAIAVTPTTLAGGVVGSAYLQTVLASGGTSPYSFVVESGTVLPPGLTLSSAGALSGMPTTAGTFDFAVRAADANACPGTRAYSVIIDTPTCPTITLSPATLPTPTVFTAYNQTLTATGGTGPYSFAVTSGMLPTGLMLSSGGGLTGTPNATATFNFTVTATATGGCAGAQPYSVTVGAATSTTTVIFEAGPHVYRSTAFTATALVTGSGGLSQSVPVTYSGNCTNVTSANGCTGNASFAGNATYLPSNGTASITIAPTTATTTALSGTLPIASTVGLSAAVTASTATVNEGTVTFTLRQGATTIGVPTPSGMVSGGSAGAVYALPGGTTSGVYTIDAVYNAGPNFVAGSSVPGTLTLTGSCPTISVSPGSLPATTVFAGYNQTLTATGGTGPYTFAVTAGTLPGGLVLSSTGSLTGAPTTAGAFDVTVTATDTISGCAGTQMYLLTVALATSTTTVTFEAGPYVYRGTPFTATALVTGPGGLAQSLTVTYTGECTVPTSTNGCTASASFAGGPLYLPSTGSQSITILQPTDAQPATGLRVDSVDGTRVRFRWTAPLFGPPPESYVLEGGINPGDVLATLPTGSSSPVFDVLVPPGSWHARLRTSAAGTLSDNSNEVAVRVAVAIAPSAPINLTGVVNGSTVGLSWKHTFEGGPPSGTLLDVTGSVVTTLPLGPGESFAFSGVPGGTYILRVRAVNAGGSSPASAPVTLTFPGACTGVPAAPLNFLAYRVGSIVSVIWDPPATGPAPTSYVLNVAGSFVGTFRLSDREIGAPVMPGSYTISVASENACGASAPISAQTVIVP